jgi:hypothetical protein
MVYRAIQRIGALPEGKRTFLWVGATDGSVKLFVNGKHVKFVDPAKGEVRDSFTGYCRSAQFDITDALVAGDNRFAIQAERVSLNELGTGGLMGPVVLFREK